MSILKTFIDNNKLSFSSGNRNSSIVPLCGYALHVGLSESDCINAIPKTESCSEVNSEISRVYKYAKKNNYNKFWEKDEAKTQYKF